VGDGELRDDIEMFIESCGSAATQMRIAGWREDIGRCLQQMNVFCLSSHMEGLCTSLLDATLMDVPLVAFETGGVPDIVRDGETGWLAPVRDSEALAKALIEALSNPDEAKRRATNARKRTEELFAIEKTAEKTLALWRRLVAEGSSHG
jgi:glycosyltransferase involved in cell wall biosynthesis